MAYKPSPETLARAALRRSQMSAKVRARSGEKKPLSVKQASKEVKPTERAKQLAAKSATAYGAGKNTKAVGGEYGGSGNVAAQHGAVKVYTQKEIEAMNRERGTMPVQLSPAEKRAAAIKAAAEKIARKQTKKFDVPTVNPNDKNHDDLHDLHQSLHIRRGYNEEMSIEEGVATAQKVMDRANVVAKTNPDPKKRYAAARLADKAMLRTINPTGVNTGIVRGGGNKTYRMITGKTPPYQLKPKTGISEEIEMNEGKMKDIVTGREETARLAAQKEPPFTPDKNKVRRGPGGPMSKARWLAQDALAKHMKAMKKEEVEQTDEALRVRDDTGSLGNLKKAKPGASLMGQSHAQDTRTAAARDIGDIRKKTAGNPTARKAAMSKAGYSVVRTEEVEQIDELTQGLIGRAANRAAAKSKEAGDYANRQQDWGNRTQNLYRDADYGIARDTERKKGDQAARLKNTLGLSPKSRRALRGTMKDIAAANEEVEQIDELKKSTLASYVNKAVIDRVSRQERDALNFARDTVDTRDKKQLGKTRQFQGLSVKMSPAEREKNLHKAYNRDIGIKRAVGKLASEEVDLFFEQDDTMEKKEMAQTQLHFMKYAAEEILEFIKMGGEIEEWYQNKLSKVHSDMEGLHSYIEGEKRRMGMVEEKTEEVMEEVEQAEEQLDEKYMGFKKLAASIKAKGGARDPEAVAAAIGRKKYGKEKFQAAAAAGKKMSEAALDPVGKEDSDIDNDGDTDKTDVYLHRKRKAIGAAIKKKVAEKMGKKQ